MIVLNLQMQKPGTRAYFTAWDTVGSRWRASRCTGGVGAEAGAQEGSPGSKEQQDFWGDLDGAVRGSR